VKAVPSRNIERWLWLAGVIVLLDQLSKWLVLAWLQPGDSIYVAPFFNWVLTFNPGAAFSFLSDAGGWQRWFFTALALAISAWIVSLLPRHSGEFTISLALTLILGGALGNVIDRLRFGAVVDFIQWHAAGFYWPAFNIADAAISVGAVLMIIDQLFGTHNSDETHGHAASVAPRRTQLSHDPDRGAAASKRGSA
jgi:signal peptidase II